MPLAPLCADDGGLSASTDFSPCFMSCESLITRRVNRSLDQCATNLQGGASRGTPANCGHDMCPFQHTVFGEGAVFDEHKDW